ncbi:patatin-like phospholipase family protein [Actinoplanes bogorensis]|uniref:Patatin-like phospholipase family protein n=1 Tax=Paractinoplanes bogorensis TaxID=1610840 RepID=A0ABS5Z5N9_9ACTN|nr:patatin-like phospholipase family protein [Actinoplanes bogorensis]MBU2670248.1 patatin-like phospholipase family protein [Actinoplanes bogorensis]
MAVPSSREALRALDDLLFTSRPGTLMRHDYLPDGFSSVDATEDGRNWVWSDPPAVRVGGYANPETYRQLGAASSVVWETPHDALAQDSRMTEDERRLYCRTSVDLTMRGGTTSGVVYPLAVCEIATTRRLRNVGGASAGAIAAATAAAAEIGRSYPPAEPDGALTSDDARTGKVRSGFAGLADMVGWVCQVGPQYAPHQHDEYRLAQLFRPAPRQRHLFALVTAVMRNRLWAVPLIALMAFGKWSRLALTLLVVGGLAVTAALSVRIGSWPPLGRSPRHAVFWAVSDLSLFFVFVAGVLVLLPLIRTPLVRPEKIPDWLERLAKVTSAVDRGRSGPGRVIVALVLFGAPLVLARLGLWHWTAGVLVGLALSSGIVVVVGIGVFRFQAEAREIGVGLVAGASPRTHRSLPEWLAGAPRPTVDPALLPWLGQALRQLAGLGEGEVLRFGHLWQGPGFEPTGWRPRARDAEAARLDWLERTEQIRGMAGDPRRRSVNLELITTDLTRQRPYRFPLDPLDPDDPDGEQLYLCLEDLQDLVDDDVLAALRDPQAQGCQSIEGGPLRLHRLPDPWNLPVAFAVRLSVALPGLFKAVRLYRLVQPTEVRDDFGRLLRAGTAGLRWPERTALAEELWFSDGGITSNFPVHLFDLLLPNWPTFGLNLGPHPEGHPHQDVWLPQDWQAMRAPSSEIRPAATSFVSAVVGTSRSWRDTMQTGMPGYRGRVAWVRQRGNEGGTNLYMSREVIASLALRGAFAGARLRRRFDDDTQMKRYLWLRLRTALGNAQHLRDDVRAGLPSYQEILTGADEFLNKLEDTYAWDPYSEGINWYRPDDPLFWAAAEQLLRDLAGLTDCAASAPSGRDAILRDSPTPHPSLRQTPPM